MATAFHGIAQRPREWRRKVAIQARVNAGADWGNCHILNISSRGMLLQYSRPLTVGSEIEIRSAGRKIPATVVWREGFRTGVAAAEPIAVADWVAADSAKRGQLSLAVSTPPAAQSGKADLAEWRELGRKLQVCAIAALGASLAIAIAALAARVLLEPLARVSTLLG